MKAITYHVFRYKGQTANIAGHGVVAPGYGVCLTEQERRFVTAKNVDEFEDLNVVHGDRVVFTPDELVKLVSSSRADMDAAADAAMQDAKETGEGTTDSPVETSAPESAQGESADVPSAETPPAVGENVSRSSRRSVARNKR